MTTKTEVLAIAREAGIDEYDNGLITTDQFAERFAALVAAKEREECAKVGDNHPSWPGRMIAAEIRNRSAK